MHAGAILDVRVPRIQRAAARERDGRSEPQHLERATAEVIQGYRCRIHMYAYNRSNDREERSNAM